MAATFANDYKYTLGYTMTQSNETVSRLISGLNVGNTSSPDIGPSAGTVANTLFTTLTAFSTGTFGSTGRWIQERAVTF